jgi:hypothetical protein
MSTEKYMAGFLDADAYVGIRSRLNATPDCEFEVSQREQFREVVDLFTTEFGGYSRVREIKGGRYTVASFRGSAARKIFERLAKYAVLKGPWMRRALELVQNAPVLKTPNEVAAFRSLWKQQKRTAVAPERNYPSRKWLAGYFDGDGSFVVATGHGSGYAYPHATILTEPHLGVGVDLIYKAFGGNICALSTGNIQWTLHLSQPSKIREFIGFFANDLIIKRAQAYYLLGLADGGNLRDGETIRRHLQSLNAQQHRLNDQASFATDLVRQVDFGIETKWKRRKLEAIVDPA